MGCVSSKNEKLDASDTQRRRLSVLKGGASGEPAEAFGGAAAAADTKRVETLLELLPDGNKRFSLAGHPPSTSQKGFEDKER